MERAPKKRNLPACFFLNFACDAEILPKTGFFSALGELAKSI